MAQFEGKLICERGGKRIGKYCDINDRREDIYLG